MNDTIIPHCVHYHFIHEQFHFFVSVHGLVCEGCGLQHARMELKWKPALALTVIIQGKALCFLNDIYYIAWQHEGFMVIGALCASESFVGDPVFQAGVARVCPGSDFSITCTHLTTLTAWRASNTADGQVCVASILHASPDTNV